MELEDLAKELGLDKLPPDKRTNMLARLNRMHQARIFIRLQDRLTDEQLTQLTKLAKQDDQAQAREEFKRLLPDYDEIVSQELEGLRQDFKSLQPSPNPGA